ncbi:hypothetical protein RHMOL_Rhmol02G0296200 [Rhododendron molle]|uniref:Uncharacterized protein n=1 Tax=Rhododendron molle TaxID=49168 RepID=A0ACC0PYG3_RHOML|nr:hypothetical protein RHMOL_Rhmol02G0296200 [Rhododendron molle]
MLEGKKKLKEKSVQEIVGILQTYEADLLQSDPVKPKIKSSETPIAFKSTQKYKKGSDSDSDIDLEEMKVFFKQFKNSTKKKCYGFGHYAQECVNKMKKKALVTKTWDDSDSDKSNEEQGADENGKRNFLAFGVTLNSHGHSESSDSETDNSEADSCDDIDEVREKYNKLHVFSDVSSAPRRLFIFY